MATQFGAYMGKIMEIDLSTETVSEYPWTDEERKLYVGGKIMAAKILYDRLTGKETAFSEENAIVIATGPLTGTGSPSSARFDVSGLSPQTGILASSNCGGSFGMFLKMAGYDALIIKGRCSSHKWIEINNDSFIFHDADEDGLWGTRTSDCQAKLSTLVGKKNFGKLCIGPAGENLVKYAGIVSDERTAGRTGLGSVLGWKNLKAITVCGSSTVQLMNKDKAKAHAKKWTEYLKSHPMTGKQMPRLGTAGLVTPMQFASILATRNYGAGRYEDFEAVSGERLAEEFNIVNKGCLTCPIRCTRTVSVNGQSVKGPELETLGLLGANICNNNMQKILDWNYLLDELGLDAISTANTLAWAMEANEKGIWNNGLSFGNTEGISELFEAIAYRRGIGDELAEGSKRLSEKYGGKEFAMHSKGLELAAYEPRGAVGQGLGYAVSNRGGCHINGGYLVIVEGLGLAANPHTPKAKADFAVFFQNLMEAISASGICIFTSYAVLPAFLIHNPNGFIARVINAVVPYLGWALRLMNKFPTALAIHLPMLHHTKMLKYAVGLNMNLGQFLRLGERGYNIERVINNRFGITAANDKLPKRLTDEPQDPSNPKSKVPLEVLKKTFYAARGWDANGIPTDKTLKRLRIK